MLVSSGLVSKRTLVRAVKVLIAIVVVGAVGLQVRRTALDLAQHPLHVDYTYLVAAVPVYLAGLTALGGYFALLMKASPSPIAAAPAVRAYLISHLGKYVPGKALVVVMRVGLAVPHGARAATAAFATLYETLVMMAAGGFLAAVGFALPPARWVKLPLGPLGAFDVPLALLGLAAGLGFLVLVEVHVFPRLSRIISIPFPNVGPEALPHLSPRLLAAGLAIAVAGWIFLGLSQVAVLRAIMPEGLPTSLWPVAIASVALATVAGFAIPMPGGLGVREWVLWTALGTVLDEDRAVVAALALRLCWVVGELLAAVVLAPLRPPRVPPPEIP